MKCDLCPKMIGLVIFSSFVYSRWTTEGSFVLSKQSEQKAAAEYDLYMFSLNKNATKGKTILTTTGKVTVFRNNETTKAMLI